MGVLFDRASMFVFLMENACAILIFVRSVSDRPCRNCIYFCFRSRTKTLNEIRITRVTANCLRRHPCKPRALFIRYTIMLFNEFWLTSAASRQNSSEQNGRSTYCAASLAPTRSVGCRWGQILRYKRKREKLSPPFTFCLSQSL